MAGHPGAGRTHPHSAPFDFNVSTCSGLFRLRNGIIVNWLRHDEKRPSRDLVDLPVVVSLKINPP